MKRIYDTTYIKSKCIHSIGFMTPHELYQYLIQLGGTQNMYCFSEEIIGEITDISAEKALECILSGMWGTCLLYLGNGVAYFQGEQEEGAPERCILLDVRNDFQGYRQ